MDEFILRSELGDKLFEEGLSLFRDGLIREVARPLDNIVIFEVEGNIVLQRRYGTDRKPLYDCDCSSRKCRHVAALIISDSSRNAVKIEDDPKKVERIRSLIDDFRDNVTSDSDYDEEGNYYDEWEIEKYGIEVRNDKVECRYTEEVCKAIKRDIRDPLNSAHLFSELFRAIDSFDYDNGGFDTALRKYREQALRSFSLISGEQLAGILADSTTTCDDVLRCLSPDILERAYVHMEKMPVQSRFARELLLKNENYEAYLQSDSFYDKMIDVLDRLIKKGDHDEARRLFRKYYSISDADSFEKESLLPYLSELGLDEVCNTYGYDLYLEKPCEEYFINALHESRDHTEEELLEYARKKHRSASGPEYDLLVFLADHDPDYVVRYVRDTGFMKDLRYGHLDLWPAKRLFWKLEAKGLYEVASIIGRGIVDTCLMFKDPKHYDDAARVLLDMGSDPGFDTVKPPHSEYFAALKETHRRKSRFWEEYRDTLREEY